jgi:ADP-heptose:LPS heptosyltransferase
MGTPAFAALRVAYPNARITLLTGIAAAPLAASGLFFDDVWTVPEEIFVNKKWGQLRRLRKRVAEAGFDLAVVFHHAWEFSAFTAWTGISHRVGLDRDGDGFGHTVRVPPPEKVHQVEEYFELARACGAEGEPGPMEVEPGEEAAREAEHLMANWPDGGRRVILVAPGGGVNPKTRMELKRWPAENFRRLINLMKDDFDVVLVGGPGDAAVTAPMASEAGVIDLAGKTSLPALYALMTRAVAFVGNDSAPMHLAAAANLPTVAFFGPTDAGLNGPWATRSLVLSAEAECRPCYKDGFFPDCRHRKCLTGITAEDAAPRIYDFLDSPDARC